jgi:hypothetical protein
MDPKTHDVYTGCLVEVSRGFSLPRPLVLAGSEAQVDPTKCPWLRHITYKAMRLCRAAMLKGFVCLGVLVVLWVR